MRQARSAVCRSCVLLCRDPNRTPLKRCTAGAARGAPGAAGAGVAEALKGHYHRQALPRRQLELLAHLRRAAPPRPRAPGQVACAGANS